MTVFLVQVSDPFQQPCLKSNPFSAQLSLTNRVFSIHSDLTYYFFFQATT